MEHVTKIVIGANYGDEGKGLVTRHFALEAKKEGKAPVVVLHNGTAQRGHTVDYSPTFRRVFHHFGSGTLDRVPSFFAGGRSRRLTARSGNGPRYPSAFPGCPAHKPTARVRCGG